MDQMPVKSNGIGPAAPAIVWLLAIDARIPVLNADKKFQNLKPPAILSQMKFHFFCATIKLYYQLLTGTT
jgi:hypothetical protein